MGTGQQSVEISYLDLDAAGVVQFVALAVELPGESNGEVAARGGALDGERVALDFVGWEREVLLQRGRLCASIRTEYLVHEIDEREQAETRTCFATSYSPRARRRRAIRACAYSELCKY